MAYLTPAELTSYIDIDISGMTAADIQVALNRAQAIIDSWLGGTLEETAYTDDVKAVTDNCCGITMYTEHRPIIEVTAVSIEAMDGSIAALALGDMRITNDMGMLELADSPNTIVTSSFCLADVCRPCTHVRATIDYTAGFAVIPEDVKIATALLFSQITLTGDASAAPAGATGKVTSFKTRNYAETYSDSRGGSLNEPSDVMDDSVVTLLRKYKQPDGQTAIGIVGA